jgi:stearoyl-CoA desaturase (delta-9 desaturase)
MTPARDATGLRRWVDGGAPDSPAVIGEVSRIAWSRVLSYLLLHAGCIGALRVGVRKMCRAPLKDVRT